MNLNPLTTLIFGNALGGHQLGPVFWRSIMHQDRRGYLGLHFTAQVLGFATFHIHCQLINHPFPAWREPWGECHSISSRTVRLGKHAVHFACVHILRLYLFVRILPFPRGTSKVSVNPNHEADPIRFKARLTSIKSPPKFHHPH